MKRLAFLAAMLALGLAAQAEDLTLSDGKVYKNVTFLKHSVTSVTIESDSGGAIVPLEKLPSDLQKRFGYDPAAAKVALTEQNQRADAAVADAADDASFKQAAGRYAYVHGKVLPRADANTYKLTVKLIESGEAILSDGRDLGVGSAVQLYVQDYAVVGGTPTSNPTAIPAGLKLSGEKAILTWPLTSDQIQTFDLIKVGVSDSGLPIFAPAGSLTKEDWVAAGRPL
jgi:hypothetical protein